MGDECQVTSRVSDPERGGQAVPFPDADFELEWVRPDGTGNVYLGRFEIEGEIQEIEGWLCPALSLYYPEAPKKLYVQVREAK